MGLEIERKFLLKNSDWKKDSAPGQQIKQGYLNVEKERTVRIRTNGKKGFLTIKGKTVKLTRLEFEYEIPIAEAHQLLSLCHNPIIEKTRYIVNHDNNTWEIDIFEGVNKGLEIAEIELESPEQKFIIPAWIGQEVSHEPKYYNANLIEKPFQNWE